MTRPKLELQTAHSPVLRYGLAVLSVATAMAAAFLLERYHFREATFPLFLLANAITCWYAGVWPAILAVVFSSLAFNYFFTEPLYSFYVDRSEIAYYIAFILFAAVMLLDLKLPKVDGLEVLKHIKSDAELRMIPVVVLTSSKEEKDMVASYKLGVNAYVVKPVDFHEFVNAIKELGVFWAIINEPPPGSVRK